MTGFAEIQSAFARAVLDAETLVPAGLARKADRVPARRFRVYRNNVYSGLIDVLAGRVPVVARLVGEEFFRAMARLYVEREPPASAVLIRYGASFPNFITDFPPAASVPYLADMAALEWAAQRLSRGRFRAAAASRARSRDRSRRRCRARAPPIAQHRALALSDRVDLRTERTGG
jgi:Putative DNA-binding domain